MVVACAVTLRARYVRLQVERALAARVGVAQRQLDRAFDVRAARGSPPAAGLRRRASSDIAEEGLKEFGEAAIAQVTEVELRTAARGRLVLIAARVLKISSALLPVAAQRVVGLALLRVAQDLVSLGDLLELLLGFFLLGRVDVGMPLAGKLAIRRLDLFSGRALGHAERLVVVLIRNGHALPAIRMASRR